MKENLMEEEAKAIQEVAKATNKALDVSQQIGSFFARVMGEPIDAATGMLADTLRYKRFENQIRLIDKTNALLKDNGLENNLRVIPPKLVLPIVQGASLEDDDELHSLWANLLASSLDPDQPIPRTGFPDILRQLEPVDVALLSGMHKWFEIRKQRWEQAPQMFPDLPRHPRPTTVFPITKRDLLEEVEIKDEDYWSAIDNLTRLGLSSPYIDEDTIEMVVPDDFLGRPAGSMLPIKNDTETHDVVKSHGGYDMVCITALGNSLFLACNY